MITRTFEDDDIKYYVAAGRVFLHRDNATKYEAERDDMQGYYATFQYQNVSYEYMKEWLKDNQSLVDNMIREL